MSNSKMSSIFVIVLVFRTLNSSYFQFLFLVLLFYFLFPTVLMTRHFNPIVDYWIGPPLYQQLRETTLESAVKDPFYSWRLPLATTALCASYRTTQHSHAIPHPPATLACTPPWSQATQWLDNALHTTAPPSYTWSQDQSLEDPTVILENSHEAVSLLGPHAIPGPLSEYDNQNHTSQKWFSTIGKTI